MALAETAAGAGPRGAGTGRGPPGRGERRSCRCGRDRCRANSDELSGGRGAPVSLAGQWLGRDSNGPGAASLQPRGDAVVPSPGKRAGRRGSWSSRALCFKSLMGPPSSVRSGPGRTFTGSQPVGPARRLGNSVQWGEVRPCGCGQGRETLTGKWFPGPAGPATAAAWSQRCQRPGLFELRHFTPGALSSLKARASLYRPAPAGRSSNAGHKTVRSSQTVSSGWVQSPKL